MGKHLARGVKNYSLGSQRSQDTIIIHRICFDIIYRMRISIMNIFNVLLHLKNPMIFFPKSITLEVVKFYGIT